MEACLLVHILIISAITVIPVIESTSFIIQNKCPYTIWPAAQTTSGSSPAIGTTGFVLGQDWSSTVDAPPGWSGRFWARTFCSTNSSGGFVCSVGDSGSGQVSCNGNGGAQPASLVEFTLNGFSETDFYDVSLIGGFNLPVTVTPRNGRCKSIGCPVDLNTLCPWPMVVNGSNIGVIACKSACSVFNTDVACCTGSYSVNCSANYSLVFKSQCPQTFVFAIDQNTNIFTCPTGGDYFITFCPQSSRNSPEYVQMLCVP